MIQINVFHTGFNSFIIDCYHQCYISAIYNKELYIIIGVLVFINSAFNNATEVKQKRFIFKFESGHLRTNSVME